MTCLGRLISRVSLWLLQFGESNCVELGIFLCTFGVPQKYLQGGYYTFTVTVAGFFFFFSGGPGVPPSGKNFVNPPPSDTCPHFWTKACPPSQGLSPKIWKL